MSKDSEPEKVIDPISRISIKSSENDVIRPATKAYFEALSFIVEEDLTLTCAICGKKFKTEDDGENHWYAEHNPY